MAQDSQDTVVYITQKSQICYDRIDEKDLFTAMKPFGRFGRKRQGGMMRAAAVTRKLWPKSKLRVFFMENSGRENQIMEWANMWSQYADISFERTYFVFFSDIRIGFDSNDGAWSYIGTDCSSKWKTMNLGFIDQGTVLHEFGHALGLIHEHQSPASGGFDWNRDEVIKSLSGPPNNWDLGTIEHNMFGKYNSSQLQMTEYDSRSIMHYSFPAEWIRGNTHPRGIPYNSVLSHFDKQLIAQLYGSPNRAIVADTANQSTTTSAPSNGTTPADNDVCTLPVFYPHQGVLKSSGDKVTMKFHTSTDKDPKVYTITTVGETDTVISLLGPNDPDKFILSDDNSGDGKNAKIEQALIPDSDYYVVVRTLDPDGGEFNLSISAV